MKETNKLLLYLGFLLLILNLPYTNNLMNKTNIQLPQLKRLFKSDREIINDALKKGLEKRKLDPKKVEEDRRYAEEMRRFKQAVSTPLCINNCF